MSMTPREKVKVTLCGQDYTFTEPSRRLARRLAPGILRLTPKIRLIQSEVEALRISEEATPEEIESAARNLSPEASALMFEIADAVCDWLCDALDIKTDAIDNAGEIELINAFGAMRPLIERPLSKSGNDNPANGPKPCEKTQASSTPPSEPSTPIGKVESTK